MQYTSIVADLFQSDIDTEIKVFWHTCPYHNERTPSWNINLETGLWYCFGCHEGGNIVKLIQKIKNVSKDDAKNIANIKGRYSVYNPNQYLLTDVEKSNLLVRPRKTDFSGIKLPADFQLINTHPYLLKRGLLPEEILADGWGISSEYKNRVILPVSSQGKLYNFLARDITGKSNRKIKNAIGGKPGLTVIGIDNIQSRDVIYVVEGYFDLITLRRLEYPIVALGWNKITEEQAKILNEFREINIIPDNDSGGQFLLKEAQKLMGKSTVNYIELPAGKKDPGECTKREILYSVKQKSYPLGKWIASQFIFNK